MENLSEGLQLMLIGMVTVFTILLIVIYGSKLLIAAINKFAPEQPKSPAKKTDDAPVAILEAAVSQLTGGKGHIVKITKF